MLPTAKIHLRAVKPELRVEAAPPCGGTKPDLHAMQLHDAYIQLVVVELAIACGCFLACIPFWPNWASRLRGARRWAAARPEQVENELEIGQGLVVLGAFGSAWLLLASDGLFSTVGCSQLSPWLFLRAPLLIAIIYGFACFAAAFGTARPPEDNQA
jgi:hypothetical protein